MPIGATKMIRINRWYSVFTTLILGVTFFLANDTNLLQADSFDQSYIEQYKLLHCDKNIVNSVQKYVLDNLS